MSTELQPRKTLTELMAEVDEHTYQTLKNSIFPGAKDESISAAVSYCKARRMDIMQKPVHIVPMYIKDATTGQGAMRDVIMQGIGSYRIQAQESGQYAGQSEPEFGEEVVETLSGITVTFPKWCKIVVKKQMPNGTIVDFCAKEFWKENYATQGKDSTAPNAMWKKRPHAQLAKCTEAQALRKAFPGVVDQAPTAEEMEGKEIDGNLIDGATGEILKAKKNNIDKVEALKQRHKAAQEPEKIDTDTGEILFTVEEIKTKMEGAQTVRELVETVDLINTLPENEKETLREIYREKQKELKQ